MKNVRELLEKSTIEILSNAVGELQDELEKIRSQNAAVTVQVEQTLAQINQALLGIRSDGGVTIENANDVAIERGVIKKDSQ